MYVKHLFAAYKHRAVFFNVEKDERSALDLSSGFAPQRILGMPKSNARKPPRRQVADFIYRKSCEGTAANAYSPRMQPAWM
jgi:hypothetical protein